MLSVMRKREAVLAFNQTKSVVVGKSTLFLRMWRYFVRRRLVENPTELDRIRLIVLDAEIKDRFVTAHIAPYQRPARP